MIPGCGDAAAVAAAQNGDTIEVQAGTYVLMDTSFAPQVPFEVVVVLNGATPAVRTVVNERVSGAVVVSSSTNLGFAGGNNLGGAADWGLGLAWRR